MREKHLIEPYSELQASTYSRDTRARTPCPATQGGLLVLLASAGANTMQSALNGNF